MKWITAFKKDVEGQEILAGFLLGKPSLNCQTDQAYARVAQDMKKLFALIAVCSSLSNRIASTTADVNLTRSLLLTFQPPKSLLVRSQSLLPLEAGLVIQVASAELNDRITMALQISQAWASAPAEIENRAISNCALADAWQRACKAAIDMSDAIQTIRNEPGPNDAPLFESDEIELLEIALSGGTPCFAPDGTLNVPGWAERRREKRTERSVVISCLFQDVFWPSKILNVSPGGVSLESALPGTVGDIFQLYFDNEQRRATIRWKNGQTMGAQWV